jgi:putative NADH-flavin reductase
MNKKVAVIGATGFVGKQVVNELSNRGYSVNAIARDSSKVEAKDNVTAISADVNNVEELAKALEGSDAVINTFNAGWTNPNLYDDFLNGSETSKKLLKNQALKDLLPLVEQEACSSMGNSWLTVGFSC